MENLESLKHGDSILYDSNLFSENYNQVLYLKKSATDSSDRSKYYLNIFSNVNGTPIRQGFIYFYLDKEKRTSDFIGLSVNPEYRNLNIGSLLVASWIDMCFNFGYNFLGANEKQRKPFLLYLLKTYGFEIFDKSLYDTRDDVIYICRSNDIFDTNKYLLFKNSRHEQIFKGTHIYKTDNYEIIRSSNNMIILDNVIIPLQSMTRNKVKYNLLDESLAKKKTKSIISRHKK